MYSYGEDSMAGLWGLHRQVAEVAPGSTGGCGVANVTGELEAEK